MNYLEINRYFPSSKDLIRIVKTKALFQCLMPKILLHLHWMKSNIRASQLTISVCRTFGLGSCILLSGSISISTYINATLFGPDKQDDSSWAAFDIKAGIKDSDSWYFRLAATLSSILVTLLDIQSKDMGRKRSLFNKESTAMWLEGAQTVGFRMENDTQLSNQFLISNYSLS